MKKLISLILISVLLLSFSACSEGTDITQNSSGSYISEEMKKIEADYKKLQEYAGKANDVLFSATDLLNLWDSEDMDSATREQKCKDVIYAKNNAVAQIEMYQWQTEYYESDKAIIGVALDMTESNINELKTLASAPNETKFGEIKNNVASVKEQLDDVMDRLK